MAETLTIYTDGACQKTRGGWAYVTMIDGVLHSKSGSEINTTNNQMELLSAREALKAFPGVPVHIISDSQYVVKGMKEYLPRWKQNGWRTYDNRPVKNKPLWQQLDDLALGRKVTWSWVKGHNHDPLNEKADQLAQAAARGGVDDNGFRATHRHVKTGGLYRVVRDRMVHIEATMEEATVYENAEGLWFIRPKSEFGDGRFEKIKRKVAVEEF